MEKNTVVLSLDDYNELKNNEVNLDELTDAYDKKIESILNGETVQLLDDVNFKTNYGSEFIVQMGCKFYSANDTTIQLRKEIQLRDECGEALNKRVKQLESRTFLDFILGRKK